MSLEDLQTRATEKLLKKRRAAKRVERLEKLLDLAKTRSKVAELEYKSAMQDSEAEIMRRLKLGH
jgi:hypothetical protein